MENDAVAVGHVQERPDDGAATRAVLISALVLGVVTVIEFLTSRQARSAAVLADALHNGAGVLTTLVVLIASVLARRRATLRLPTGVGRIEDLAALVMVVVIVFSAAAAAFTSLGRLLSSEGYQHAVPAMAAALVGLIANLGVSEYKIRVGRRVGSIPLETDGFHSRLDALVSGGALVGLLLAWMGFAVADPLAGVGVTIAMVFILSRTVSRLDLRIMDAVDPNLIAEISAAARSVRGVLDVHDVRARWVGRELVAVVHVDCDPAANLKQAHDIAVAVDREITNKVPTVRLDVKVDPGTGSLTRST
jgi:cation diffusion facilitator family transporter